MSVARLVAAYPVDGGEGGGGVGGVVGSVGVALERRREHNKVPAEKENKKQAHVKGESKEGVLRIREQALVHSDALACASTTGR